MTFWEKLKKDLEHEMKEGMDAIKSGAEKVREKAGELTEEGKKAYMIFSLKKDARDTMAELGARVYVLAGDKLDIGSDSLVNTELEKIKKLEAQITGLEKAK
jgi:hypothetical protein